MLFKATEPKYHPNATLERAPGGALHPARRPRAELLDQRRPRRSARPRSTRTRAVAGGVAAPVRAAARRRQRRGAADAGGDRLQGAHPRLHQGGQETATSRLMGFGHRVYKNYDPRAKIIKRMADEVFEVTRPSPLLARGPRARADRARGRVLHLAQALSERGLLFRPHLPGHAASRWRCSPCSSPFARTSGWLAQWQEMRGDPEQKIARPRQLYLGSGKRAYVEMGKREEARERRA